MIESFLVYSSLALVMIIYGMKASRQSRLATLKEPGWNNTLSSFLQPYVLIPIFAFTFIFGCRYNVGVDFPHYLYTYNNIWAAQLRGYEAFFSWITIKMSRAGLHYSFYFSLWAFIQITLLYYAFRRQRYLFPYIAFFLIFGFFFMSMMNIIRQQIAACLFMVAINYINEKKIIKYYLCVWLAMQFHASALLLVLAYPFFYKKQDYFTNVKWQLYIYIGAFIISVFFERQLMNALETPFNIFTTAFDYENYQFAVLQHERLNSLSQFGNNTGLGIYIRMFITLPIIIYSNRLKQYYNSSFFNIIYTLWFFRVVFEFLTGDSLILNRPFVYVVNFKMIMLAYFTYYCFNAKPSASGKASRHENMRFWAVSFICIHFLLLINLISNGTVNTSRFQFFWQVQDEGAALENIDFYIQSNSMIDVNPDANLDDQTE